MLSAAFIPHSGFVVDACSYPGKLNKCSYGYFSFLENKYVPSQFSHNDSVFYLYMTENMLIKKLSQNIANMSLSCLPFASTDDCRIMEIMKHNIKCICSFFFFFKNPFTEFFCHLEVRKKKSDINSTGKNCTRDETVAVLMLKKYEVVVALCKSIFIFFIILPSDVS